MNPLTAAPETPAADPLAAYQALESEVRSYCRAWPVEFETARGSTLTTVDGREYLDFFAGAGALNYGHNHPALTQALVAYVESDGIAHGMDMHTVAKRRLLETLRDVVLSPRGLRYRVQFPGPTGTNAVEAALKLARKVTGRESVVNFTNAFHGMTLGALSVTGNAAKRAGAGVPLVHTTPMPFDGYLRGSTPDFGWFEALLADSGSSLNRPAAVIVETVQGEGGLNVARVEWLRGLAELCRRHEMLLIVDDVQMGVGRTGPFFSFEAAGIEPDIVCLSKSISGAGLPLALVLLKPEHDVWSPGEHNGTFRGNNHAFVTARQALLEFWADDALERSTVAKGERVHAALAAIAAGLPEGAATPVGVGLARGLRFADAALAPAVCAAAFDAGLLLETAGPEEEVVKLMPALTIPDADLDTGLSIVAGAVAAAMR